MRKILTRQEVQKKKNRNQIVIGGILIALMVLSTAGYAIFNTEKSSSGQETYEYGDITFYKQNNFWVLKASGQDFYFNYLPEDAMDVNLEGNFSLSDYSGKPLYYFNSDDSLFKIVNNLGSFTSRTPQQACMEGFECSGDFPLKNCANDNIILFNESERDSVVKNGSCVYISGNISKSGDAFLYRVFGIN